MGCDMLQLVCDVLIYVFVFLVLVFQNRCNGLILEQLHGDMLTNECREFAGKNKPSTNVKYQSILHLFVCDIG